MNKFQQARGASAEKPIPREEPPDPASAIPPGLTPAWFTPRELDEIRKICRHHDGELGSRFLQEALNRADRGS